MLSHPSAAPLTVAPDPAQPPEPQVTTAPSPSPSAPALTPASPTQLVGQKRKRPTPPPSTTATPQSPSVPTPAQHPPAHHATPAPEPDHTEAALINQLIAHQEHNQAPVAQMLPPTNTRPQPGKPPTKRQRKSAPKPQVDETHEASQASAGADNEGGAAAAPVAKPKKPRAPRAKRQPRSAATVVEDEHGNIIESEEPVASARPAPKPRKPRQKKQKKQPQPQPEGQDGEAEQVDQDEEEEDLENHEIDVDSTTMFDLTRDRGYGKVSERETKMSAIDWKEVQRKRLEEAEAIRSGQDPSTTAAQPAENNQDGEGENNQETPRPPPVVSGPRLRLDAEGNLVVDEESLRIDRQAQAARNAENLTVTENDDLTKRINSMSWINERRRDPTDRVPFFKMKSDPWSDEETDRFYEALRMFGTDFFIISKMFPPKTRRQIKLKFIREERLDPARVNRVLAGEAVPMNLESFAEATGQNLEGFKDPRELEEELRVEGEEQRVEIARRKKEIEEAKQQRDIQMAAREKDQEERAAQRREKAAMRQNRRKGIFGTGTF